MRLDCKLNLAVLLVFLISDVSFRCQASPSSQQQQQQQRHIGPQAGKNSSSVERIAAILAVKPRSGSSTASQKQRPANEKSAGPVASKLHSEASTLDSKSVSNLTAGAAGSSKQVAKNQGKRQADFVDQNRPSRRNEDPWFLDQAPLPLQPYRFVYNVKDKNGLTEQYRQETGDGKFLTGSYGYVLPDGIFRHVDYVADDRGFRAFIRTSEPGTANQNPADVVINSSPVPGVSYVSPATISSTLGSQSPLLPGTQQQPSQSNWADQARASWNYSTLGSLGDRVTSNLDGSTVLARRAPGSIVGTPLRNFSSLAYPFTPSPPLDLSPPSSSYFSNQDAPSSFQSLSRFGDLTRLQPAGGGASSSSNSTSQNDQFQTPLTASGKLERERDRSSNGFLLSGAAFESARRGAQERAGLYAVQPPSYQRPGLLLSSRVGPDVLLYDRPFGVQQVPGEPSSSSKLSYDYNHIVGRDTASLLAEEKAKNLAYLEQLKLLSRNIARPDLTTNELGTLSPLSGPLPYRQLASSLPEPVGGPAATSAEGETGTKTSTSSSHSEHHQEHKSSTSQLVDDVNRITLTREHKSGSASGSGHDSGISLRQPLGEQSLTPPPQPQFSGGASQQRWATKGQQPTARLLAPYVDEHQFGRKGGVKGAQEQTQQLVYDNQRTTGSPVPPDEPRAPAEPSQPLGESEHARQTSAGSARATPADEIELNQSTASKSVPLTTGSASPNQQHHQVRSIRMPDDYRTSMLMNDLRSMQNAFGLPQPPRLQRSSPIVGEHRIVTAGPANLAEQIVAARMSRVDALLSGAGSAGNVPVAPQQASVQRSVTVPADKRELEEPKSLEDANNRSARASISTVVPNRQTDNEIEDDQPRRMSTGPVLTQHSGQGNETSMFDAQRLSNNRARLRADKVSELEKFQQRLRTQQLLLEHVKSNENKVNGLVQRQPLKANASLKVNDANSHVKYDEPQENELAQLGMAGKSDDHGRLRRQNDNEAATNRTSARKVAVEATVSNSPQIVATTRAPAVSELARQLQQWPSISAGLETRQQMNTSSGSLEPSHASGLVALKAHKMDSPKQNNGPTQDGGSSVRQTEPTTSGSPNGTQQGSPNTINLDFINSVTALSVDQLNPFAISSVNPAVQRTIGASSERLSPHRLAMPLAGLQQQSHQHPPDQSTGGASLLATAPARYFSSPELLAALNHHERHDTGQRIRNLLSLSQTGPANHRTNAGAGGSSSSANAPYMMQPQEQAASRSLDSILGAKFIVGPATASANIMSEAANSQHKSVVPTPKPPEELGIRQSRSSHSRMVGAVQRDGFEVRDRAVQADNHRFYEVVSNLRQPSELSASFQAFRDAQLSIPANSRR